MKLNNRGWGLGVFLGFVVVLVLCIIVAGINAYRMGLSSSSPKHYFDSEIPNEPSSSSSAVRDYNQLEETVRSAAEKYKQEKNPDFSSGSVSVSFQSLIRDGYMSSIAECSGYVQLTQEDRSTYSVYFHCPDHITSGYNSKLDEK